jgi:hypothetical protein
VARLKFGSGDVLARIDVLASGSAALYRLRLGLEAGVELPAAGERRHHDVPALVALRVVPVVIDDAAAQAVILGVNSGHNPKSRISGPDLSLPRNPPRITGHWPGTVRSPTHAEHPFARAVDHSPEDHTCRPYRRVGVVIRDAVVAALSSRHAAVVLAATIPAIARFP